MTTSGLLNLKSGDALVADIADLSASATEINYLSGVTAGTAVASKAVVLDASKDFNFGTGDITATNITASTAILPDASGGADIGSATAEFGDVYIADDKKIYLGSDQDASIEYDEDGGDTLRITGAVTLVNDVTVTTALLPDAVGGADIGSATLEFGDVYIADDKKIKFGNDQDASIEYDETTLDALKIIGQVNFADGTTDVDIASHDGSNGLKLGGTLVTATAAEINAAADLSVQGALMKVKKLSISSAPTGAEQDTTFDLPVKSVVYDVFVDVTTAEATGATKTLDVGLLSSEGGGDADGFIDGVDVSSLGLKKGNFVTTSGGNNAYVGAASTHTIGALLTSLLIAGEDVANGGDGVATKGVHANNGTAVSVTYTAGSGDWVEFRGDIYVVYMEIG